MGSRVGFACSWHFFRFKHLGYAEFLTDEARVVLRATAVVQGSEDVLFLHRKGPVEILLPAMFYAATGYIDEMTARLPFAIASLLGLLAIFRLGWQRSDPAVGCACPWHGLGLLAWVWAQGEPVTHCAVGGAGWYGLAT
jgi:hypothetical protein